VNFTKLKTVNKDAWKYLDNIPKEAWTKSYFKDHTKVDILCNNNCEVFNAKIVEFKTKPIIKFLDEVKGYIYKTICEKKHKLANYVGKLPPVQQNRLDKERKKSDKWTPSWSGILTATICFFLFCLKSMS